MLLMQHYDINATIIISYHIPLKTRNLSNIAWGIARAKWTNLILCAPGSNILCHLYIWISYLTKRTEGMLAAAVLSNLFGCYSVL